MNRQESRPGLRPYLAEDAPMLAAIFRASIEDLTVDDYDDDQLAAWMETADDEERFAQRFADALTLVATLEGAPAGFASLKGNSTIDMLYVYPSLAGQGIGTMLVDALETLARARGATQLTVEASDTARSFFEHRGYTPQRRNVVPLNGAWLANTTMTRQLDPQGAGAAQGGRTTT